MIDLKQTFQVQYPTEAKPVQRFLRQMAKVAGSASASASKEDEKGEKRRPGQTKSVLSLLV